MALIGFEKQKAEFHELITLGQLSHPYLFSGPDMIGKKMLALELAEEINGRSPFGDADFRILAPKLDEEQTQIQIEDVRDLKSFVSLRPTFGPYKIVIIDDADRLTEPASNALLKLLEEPQGKTIVFLITSHINDLLPTIRSRSMEIKFLPHGSPLVRQAISSAHLSDADADLAVLLADGRIGWAINAVREKKIQLLKVSIDEFQQVLRQGIFERMQYAKKIYEEGNYQELVLLWMHWIRTYGKNPERTRSALTRLLRLHVILSRPQYNHRLALENFLINLT